jgi:trk system potassium uptake protein TrkH
MTQSAGDGMVVRTGRSVRGGARAGDRRLRLSRPPSERVPLPPPGRRRRQWHPAAVFVAGFAGLVAAGTLLLMLPVASAGGAWTAPLDALFTATSAVCVTGLVVVDTAAHWGPFGHAVILLLVQIGGLGFMTSSTFLLLLMRRQATLRERILLKEALGSGGLGSALHLARRVLVFTLAVEAAGAVVLAARFLRDMEAPQALWWAVFHAVSAFNNAGFDLVGGYRSLTPYRADAAVLLPVGLLVVLGASSYTAAEDVARRRRWTRLTLDTKLVLATTAAVTGTGTLALLFTEWSNPETLGGLPAGPRLLNAVFHSAAARTAGFNAVPTDAVTDAGLLVLIGLMFIGGASGSTAGGIKLQTFSLLLFAILSTAAGSQDIQAFRRRIPTPYVLRALTVALLALAVVFAVAFALSMTERGPFVALAFEAFSAFATVGLSTGITPDLSPAGRLIVTATMFVGRLGPLTLVIALAARERRTSYRWAEEGVKIG